MCIQGCQAADADVTLSAWPVYPRLATQRTDAAGHRVGGRVRAHWGTGGLFITIIRGYLTHYSLETSAYLSDIVNLPYDILIIIVAAKCAMHAHI